MDSESSIMMHGGGDYTWTDIGISLLWGFGIALLFRKICKNGECLVVKNPNQHMIKNKVYKDRDQCFKLIAEKSPCNDGNPI